MRQLPRSERIPPILPLLASSASICHAHPHVPTSVKFHKSFSVTSMTWMDCRVWCLMQGSVSGLVRDSWLWPWKAAVGSMALTFLLGGEKGC